MGGIGERWVTTRSAESGCAAMRWLRWLVLPAGQPTPALRVRSAEGDEEKICGDDESVNPQLALRKVIDETEMGSDRIISQSSGLYTHSPAQTCDGRGRLSSGDAP